MENFGFSFSGPDLGGYGTFALIALGFLVVWVLVVAVRGRGTKTGGDDGGGEA